MVGPVRTRIVVIEFESDIDMNDELTRTIFDGLCSPGRC